MGAKTALLAYAAGGVADALRNRPAGTGGVEGAEALVRRLHPGWRVEPEADGQVSLGDAVYPPEDTAYAASFPGVDVLCHGAVMGHYPSRFPARYLDAADGRTVVLHAMHSVVDSLTFALWRDGVLVRSLCVTPKDGVMEDIGERLSFETPYWAGEHPVEPIPGRPNQDPYALPFHPLDLGEEALRALFGFIIEGRRMPDDIDADDVPVHRFRLTDPDGPTPEQRQAVRDALVARMKPPRIFRMEGGRLVETDLP
ncbi:DUF6928 family protein [Yinghuangia sp. YIM S09857]|uniref:DUF6928 family protein n=1 Tax=Yinghuangia sp. YIM S09857 TaxID=3436929 RepID=UPI003F53BE2A